jgi:hypothetical protein
MSSTFSSSPCKRLHRRVCRIRRRRVCRQLRRRMCAVNVVCDVDDTNRSSDNTHDDDVDTYTLRRAHTQMTPPTKTRPRR